MYIFLDESGDLGFDFSREGTSHYFVVTLLTTNDFLNKNLVEKSVEKTIKNKILVSRARSEKWRLELKGANTDIQVKAYFITQLAKAKVEFCIYTTVLNKKKVSGELQMDKDSLYDYVASKLIERIPFKDAAETLRLTVDRRKKSGAIGAFNEYVASQIRFIKPSHLPLEVFHVLSHQSKGIQAVDLFSWGIFRKYERGDCGWYDMFKHKIAFETDKTEYLPIR